MKRSLILFFFSLLLWTGCRSEDTQAMVILKIRQDTLVCNQQATTLDVWVQASAPYKVIVPEKDASWCTVSIKDKGLQVKLTGNVGLYIRETKLRLESGNITQSLYIKQLGEAPAILVNPSRFDLNAGDTTVCITTASNVEYSIVIPDTVGWIQPLPSVKGMQEYAHSFQILTNTTDEIRFTNLLFKSGDGKIEVPVMVTQAYRNKEYNPEIPDGIGDIQIPVYRGEASQAQKDQSIEMSFDGDPGTMYHSPWSGTKLPVTLDYYFEKSEVINYIIYKPRPGGGNGDFGQFDLFISTDEQPEYHLIGNYDFSFSKSISRVNLETVKSRVRSVRFIVKTGTTDFVSCSEMEFYQKGNPVDGLTAVFADEICSKLKEGVTQKQISALENDFFRSIAQSLFDKTYPAEYRIQEYESYPTIEETARELKISGYCPFENATGIYFEANQEVVVMVGDTHGERIELKVYDFDAARRGEPNVTEVVYLLERGINKIKLQNAGLAYINYFTNNWKLADPVRIHIPSGKINGYFDKKRHTRTDWKALLANAEYGCFDIKGDAVNLVFGVSSLKQYCDDGLALIDIYDKIVTIEHEIMGLMKYNRRPKNHMFAREVKSGLFADGWGAGFQEGSMKELADPDFVSKGSWAVAHEFGHVNQIRPGLKWVSTSELTNNIYSICITYLMNRENLNLERERVNDGDNNYVLGGRFNSYLNYGIVKGELWLCQRGDNKMEGYENGGDHFVKLCPIWQLLLYYREIAGKRDWYADVAEIVRNTDESKLTDGQLQLNFMRNTCDVLKEDLTDFFIKAGMLKPIDRYMDDYTSAQLTITQQQCDDLVAYASKYPKPATPVLYYLTGNSEKTYKERLSVEGTFNKGIDMKEGYCRIDHAVWKNVTVFETYAGNELIKVAMVGTDSANLNNTLVRYPGEATRIEAVAWNGERMLVYGDR